jgi:mRNA-degrading endonuclease RelE of RelBE toxin-antitoxin system
MTGEKPSNLYRIDAGFGPFLSEYKSALKKFPTFKSDIYKKFEELESAPTSGDRMKYTNTFVYKIRIGVKKQGIGKSGGFRLIYHVDDKRRVITPLAVYYKPDKTDIEADDLQARLKKLIDLAKKNKSPVATHEHPSQSVN